MRFLLGQQELREEQQRQEYAEIRRLESVMAARLADTDGRRARRVQFKAKLQRDQLQ